MATLQQAKERFEQAGLTMGNRYIEGAQGKGSEWASQAVARKANWVQGVQQAVNKDSYSSGIREAGAAAYDRGVEQKGETNWSSGMQIGSAKYESKVSKFASLWSQKLPTPRGVAGSPENRKRIDENIARFQNAAK